MSGVFHLMEPAVKPRRQYDSRRRREQAAQTRRDIEAAADKLFRERGYVGTSMPAIAAEAGVVVETVYRAFGSKARLFKAVIEAALAGGSERAELPPAERPAIRAVIEETDPRRKLELYAATQPGVHGRSSPLYRVLVAAADSDPELRDVLDGMEARRLHGLGGLAAQLAEIRALRSDLSVDDARDIIWTLCSTPVHDLLVRERGWTSQRYRDWLAAALQRELLHESV
ncbi:MAG TPA: helix-turn-helix domain-containing protein [Propionibacteriaceae bacterium]|nr:helix-turn-helix domain-containing protein [Propionibacteriaceae bacterium]